MRVCILGAGGITELGHLPAYLAAGTEIAGIADVDVVRAEGLASRFPVGRVYADWREMLETERPEIVSVCLPNGLHEDATVTALEGGAHVLCEKPLAPTAEAAERMFAAARRHGRQLMAAQQFRWAPGILAVKEVIDAGDIGDVYFAETSWVRRFLLPSRPGQHSRAMSGGGVLIDLGVHALDQTLWLMGNPKPLTVSAMSARAFGNRPEIAALGGWIPDGFDVEDFAVAFVRLEGGSSVVLKTAWAANMDADDYRLSTTILGSEAGVVTDPPAVHRLRNGRPATETFPNLGRRNAWVDEIAHWVEVAKGNVEPLVRPEETLNVLRILDASYRSAAEGREVALA